MNAVDEDSEPLSRFREEAIEWAIGGRGQQIVDAAAVALAEGLDSPSLRMLAGAPHALADEEASGLAPLAFRELGLDVHERLSPGAYLDGARQEARHLVDGKIATRELARRLARFCAPAGYPTELSTWAGLDDYYELIEDGVVNVPLSVLDEAVQSAAEDLVNQRHGRPVTLAALFPAPAVEPARPRGWRSRVQRRR